ncbi:MAG: hypothetical protein KAI43_04980 [Candidatus Aureabacteria bacterium]|nr:hypothetical protein [Candidatus Auribacterota bacterium]
MNCAKCKNLILENNHEMIKDHLSVCTDCKEFYKTYNDILKLEPKKTEAPSNITFNALYKKPKKEKPSYTLIKWAVPAAAALLLFFTYLPNWLNKTGNLKVKEEIFYISKNISNEMENIETDISYLEQDILSADSLIENEIELLMDEIELYNLEV